MKHRSLSVAGLFGACLVLGACASVETLDAAGPPAAADGRTSAWMQHLAVNRDIAYGDEPEQRLDVYLQGTWTGEPTFFERAAQPRPTLLFIHGGGWVVRDRRPEPWIFPFIESGWHVVSMTYRLGAGTAPAAVDDGVCALQWLTRNAAEYGFDLDRVVVAGVSAGGHLALTTGILGSRPGHACAPGEGFRVRAVINWVGITDIAAVEQFLADAQPVFGNYALAWIGDPARVQQISAAYSPVGMLDATSPAVLTIHGTADQVVPFSQAVALHDRLAAFGIRNELLGLEGGTHAGFTDAQFAQAFREALAFAEAD